MVTQSEVKGERESDWSVQWTVPLNPLSSLRSDQDESNSINKMPRLITGDPWLASQYNSPSKYSNTKLKQTRGWTLESSELLFTLI